VTIAWCDRVRPLDAWASVLTELVRRRSSWSTASVRTSDPTNHATELHVRHRQASGATC